MWKKQEADVEAALSPQPSADQAAAKSTQPQRAREQTGDKTRPGSSAPYEGGAEKQVFGAMERENHTQISIFPQYVLPMHLIFLPIEHSGVLESTVSPLLTDAADRAGE